MKLNFEPLQHDIEFWKSKAPSLDAMLRQQYPGEGALFEVCGTHIRPELTKKSFSDPFDFGRRCNHGNETDGRLLCLRPSKA